MGTGYSFLCPQLFSVQWHLQKLLSLMSDVYVSMSLYPLFGYWAIMNSAKHTASMSLFRPMETTNAFQSCIKRQNTARIIAVNPLTLPLCVLLICSHPSPHWSHWPVSHVQPRNATRKIPDVNYWEGRPSGITKNPLLKKGSRGGKG